MSKPLLLLHSQLALGLFCFTSTTFNFLCVDVFFSLFVCC